MLYVALHLVDCDNGGCCVECNGVVKVESQAQCECTRDLHQQWGFSQGAPVVPPVTPN